MPETGALEPRRRGFFEECRLEVLIALWVLGIAVLDGSLLRNVPDTPLAVAFMAIPMLLGLGVLLFILGRSATTLADQNRKLVEAERAASALASELGTILESISSLMFVTDQAGRLSRVNQAFKNQFGEEWLHRSLEDVGQPNGKYLFLHEDHKPFVKGQFPHERALAGETVENEIAVIKGVGIPETYYLASAAPIYDPQTKEVIGSVTLLRDITSIKQLERAKDEFLHIVSHELRSPLAVVRAYAQLSLSEEHPQQTLASMMREIDQMSAMLEQMLQITRIDTGRITLSTLECDLAEVTTAQVARLCLTPGYERVVLDTEEVDGPLICRLDIPAYSQIIANLVSNALKYSKAPHPVAVRLSSSEGKAVVSVIDHGSGIPEDEIPLIFDKFYRARKASESSSSGLGLGLYVTAQLVKAMSGEIKVESKLGKGTTFHVAFPLRSSSQPV